MREYSEGIKNDQIKAITKKLTKKLKLDPINSAKVNLIIKIAFKILRFVNLPPLKETILRKSTSESDKGSADCPSPSAKIYFN